MLYHLELTTLGIGMVRSSLRRWLRENAGQGPRHAETPRLKDAGDAGHQPTNAKYTTIPIFLATLCPEAPEPTDFDKARAPVRPGRKGNETRNWNGKVEAGGTDSGNSNLD
jgi:hypothetical protein